ncbi:MAG TPA: hypothetical protein VGN90_15870 [Pyrinomonadaceae bacterium]|jgi:hypothetical protein|nr:hypothetical protein [Pyrinomonadaceae bacterium]
MSTNVERVLDQIRSLSPEEQRQVRVALNSSGKAAMTEDEFEQHLLANGVITEIPPPLTEADIEAFRNYKPISVEGKPVSETIIEERR